MQSYASEEELKIDSLVEEPSTYNPMIEREFTVNFRAAYAKMLQRLTIKKTDCNTFGYALRLFKIPITATLGFPSI